MVTKHEKVKFQARSRSKRGLKYIKKSLQGLLQNTVQYELLVNANRLNDICCKFKRSPIQGYPLGLSTYSARVQRANDRVIAPNIVQNAANELIEHKLILSAPLRFSFTVY